MTDYKKPKHAEIINHYFSFKQSLINWSDCVWFVIADCMILDLDFGELTGNDILPRFNNIMEEFKDIPDDAVMEFIKFQHITRKNATDGFNKMVLTLSSELHHKFGKRDETFEDVIRSIVCLIKDE
jgi:hypothetical protein